MCVHPLVTCLNPYEYIRKYRCDSCGEVLMCACDEPFARRFLPHQLAFATELSTQKRIPVTAGFQPSVCRECRGLPAIAYPKAPMHGATSKIRRYYWRELFMETTTRFAQWAEASGYSDVQTARQRHPEEYRMAEAAALEHIKQLHRTSPKYTYHDKSHAQVIEEYGVEVIELQATHTHRPKGHSRLLVGPTGQSPEEFAQDNLKKQGIDTIFTESSPFHVLFAVLMCTVLQDPVDPQVEIRSFGKRDPLPNTPPTLIHTPLPTDFGTPGYIARRQTAIAHHLSSLPRERSQILDQFDSLLPNSSDLRQYLWAHEQRHVDVARRIIQILSAGDLLRILEYLIGDYWRRYVGWPDLLAYSEAGVFFAEVKSSGDQLSEDQKRWIADNSLHLHLPFKLIKIRKEAA